MIRPELFLVKEEHKDPPCSYLASDFSTLKKVSLVNKMQKKQLQETAAIK
jgi:hypothetical protein